MARLIITTTRGKLKVIRFLEDYKSDKNQGIKVISRATDILRVLGQSTTGLSLGQIALRVSLPRSTVQRIVAALEFEGFISIEAGNAGIRLGPEVQSLAQARSSAIRDRLRPLMQQISEATGETVATSMFGGKSSAVSLIAAKVKVTEPSAWCRMVLHDLAPLQNARNPAPSLGAILSWLWVVFTVERTWTNSTLLCSHAPDTKKPPSALRL